MKSKLLNEYKLKANMLGCTWVVFNKEVVISKDPHRLVFGMNHITLNSATCELVWKSWHNSQHAKAFACFIEHLQEDNHAGSN